MSSHWWMNNHVIYCYDGNGGWTEIAKVTNVRACKALVNNARAAEKLERVFDNLLATEYDMPTKEADDDDH